MRRYFGVKIPGSVEVDFPIPKSLQKAYDEIVDIANEEETKRARLN